MRVRGSKWGLIGSVAAAALALPLVLTVATAPPGLAAVHSVVRARTAASPSGVRQVCPAPTRPGQMACMALLPKSEHGGVHPDLPNPEIYDPADLQSAYQLTAEAASGGSGETVAVVDAYNDPDAAADLAVYRKEWGLAACDSSTGAGCVTVVNEHGAAHPLPGADPYGEWEVEESVDMEMVTAICPLCHILLVEANTPDITGLAVAEDSAVRLGARFVNDSWGGAGNASYNRYFDHPGVAITVAAGDFGYGGTYYPASSQLVTSVGGTTLTPAPGTARGWRETAWDGTDSGCAFDPNAGAKPAWQTMDDSAASGCLNRTENDVSAVADPNTPVWFYDSYPELGQKLDWEAVGGTSVASPIIAAVYALAGTPKPGTYPASYLYQPGHSADLYPVTSGHNGVCQPAYLCNAADDYPGTTYNGPTGWGTPDGTTAFTSTATGDTITVVDPGTQDAEAGQVLRLPVSGVDSAPGQQLRFSAAGLPAGLVINPATGVISGRLPAKTGTSKVTVTATDSTGATGSVSFDLVAIGSLRAAYHRVTGPVTLDVNGTGKGDMCLYDADNRSANGTKVEVWKCDRSAAEQWTYLPDAAPDSNGTLVVHGKCATIVGPRDGQHLRLEACTGAGDQGWSLLEGQWWLYNPASGLCMNDPRDSTHDGTQVNVFTCGYDFNEAFMLPAGPVLSGVGGLCLTDPRNSRKAGTKLQAQPCDGSAAQLWTIFSNPDYVEISPGIFFVALGTQHNGLCAQVTGTTVPGTPVLLGDCGTGLTSWNPLPDGQVASEFSDLCLAASGAGRNRPIVLEPCYGSADELWAEG